MAFVNSVLPHTCEHCQRILFDKPVKKESYAQYDVTLPHTRGEVYEAVQAGCPLFSLYPNFPFFDLSVAQSLDLNSWQPWFYQPHSLRFEGWQRRSALMLAESMLNPYDRPFEISYNTEGDLSLRCLSWVSEVDTMRIVASPEDPAAQDIVSRPIKDQVDTEETFEFLQSQTQECYKTHCVDVCCLHIQNFGGRGEGLLLVKDAEEDVYQRIGHFYYNLEDLRDSFEHAEKVEVKIV